MKMSSKSNPDQLSPAKVFSKREKNLLLKNEAMRKEESRHFVGERVRLFEGVSLDELIRSLQEIQKKTTESLQCLFDGDGDAYDDYELIAYYAKRETDEELLARIFRLESARKQQIARHKEDELRVYARLRKKYKNFNIEEWEANASRGHRRTKKV